MPLVHTAKWAVYKRGEYGQVARALRVLDALHGFRRGRSLTELAAEVGASERTIKRDLAELEHAGFEIERQPVDGRPGARLPERHHSRVAITKRERYTLLAVRSMFDVLHGTPLWEDVASVQRKLEQRMSREERAEHATFGERFAYVPDGGTKLYEGKEDVLNALLTGVLSRRVVRFAYQDGRGRAQRGYLAAFAMLVYKHGLYVVGRRLRKPEDNLEIPTGGLGIFAAERFTEAEHVRGAAFVPPADFTLANVMHGAFGIHIGDASAVQDVVIEFGKAKAAYVRARRWHPGQRFDELPDGRVRLSFPCVNLMPVVSWVLEWGPHARAVAPAELVAVVRRELDEARAQYK